MNRKSKETCQNYSKNEEKLDRPPTTQVYVTENNQRRVATTKEDVEQVCINKNDSRFSQSSDTADVTERCDVRPDAGDVIEAVVHTIFMLLLLMKHGWCRNLLKLETRIFKIHVKERQVLKTFP